MHILLNNKLVEFDDADRFLLKYVWKLASNPSGRTTYAKTSIRGKTVLMHRMLAAKQKTDIVDHIDGNGLNNSRSNLRTITTVNSNHARAKRAGCTSIFIGVTKLTNKWQSNIRLAGKSKHLGRFGSEIDAAIAYNKAALIEYGEYAKLNPIPFTY